MSLVEGRSLDTRYFDKIGNSYIRTNYIDKLKNLIQDMEQIKHGVLDYYQNVYEVRETWRPTSWLHSIQRRGRGLNPHLRK